MTDDELKQIEERATRATAGKWTWEDEPIMSTYRCRVATVYSGRDGGMHGMNLFGRIEPDWNGTANLDFICHARADVPALIAEIRRLREIEEANGIPEEMRITYD